MHGPPLHVLRRLLAKCRRRVLPNAAPCWHLRHQCVRLSMRKDGSRGGNVDTAEHIEHVPRCVVLGHGTGGHSRKGAQRLDAVMGVGERFCGTVGGHDEALHISEVRGTACNHPFVAAHAGPRTARVAAVVVVGPVPTAPAALGCFG
eukprot:scaffold26504_cov56-Phaeocystis_antarctica.AAC.1